MAGSMAQLPSQVMLGLYFVWKKSIIFVYAFIVKKTTSIIQTSWSVFLALDIINMQIHCTCPFNLIWWLYLGFQWCLPYIWSWCFPVVGLEGEGVGMGYGVVEYWIRLRVPMEQALRLYKVSCYTSQNGLQFLSLLSEL